MFLRQLARSKILLASFMVALLLFGFWVNDARDKKKLSMFAISSSKVGRTNSRTKPQQSLSALDVPIRAKPCSIQDEVHAASRVTSRKYEDLHAEFMSTIESFSVTRGQIVKRGQLIAKTDASSISRLKEIYEDYVHLYEGQMKIAQENYDVALRRRGRLEGLAKKGIIPQSEIEQAERLLLAAADFRERIRRGVEGMQKNVDLYAEQIKKSNFYSGIDGVVTALVVDPRSMVGKLNVMPGSLVAKIEQPGLYRASALLMDSQIHRIKKGMKAEVTLPDQSVIIGDVSHVGVLPAEESRQDDRFGGMDGDGYQSSSSAQKASVSLYQADIDFSKPGEILPSGLLANVRIVTGETKVKSCLPWNALDIADGKPSVRMFNEGQGWQKIPVLIGKTGRYDVEIKSPVPPSAVIASKLW